MLRPQATIASGRNAPTMTTASPTTAPQTTPARTIKPPATTKQTGTSAMDILVIQPPTASRIFAQTGSALIISTIATTKRKDIIAINTPADQIQIVSLPSATKTPKCAKNTQRNAIILYKGGTVMEKLVRPPTIVTHFIAIQTTSVKNILLPAMMTTKGGIAIVTRAILISIVILFTASMGSAEIIVKNVITPLKGTTVMKLTVLTIQIVILHFARPISFVMNSQLSATTLCRGGTALGSPASTTSTASPPNAKTTFAQGKQTIQARMKIQSRGVPCS